MAFTLPSNLAGMCTCMYLTGQHSALPGGVMLQQKLSLVQLLCHTTLYCFVRAFCVGITLHQQTDFIQLNERAACFPHRTTAGLNAAILHLGGL